jgi:hypothetical protein
LPAIALGPVYANGMMPIRWYHDLDCVDDVAFADTMTIENGLDHAYNKGISRGKQLHVEELDNSYDRGYNHGKLIQAAHINGAFAAGRLQQQQASIHRSSSCVSTVRALSAIRCSVMTTITEESTPAISVEVPQSSSAGDLSEQNMSKPSDINVADLSYISPSQLEQRIHDPYFSDADNDNLLPFTVNVCCQTVGRNLMTASNGNVQALYGLSSRIASTKMLIMIQTFKLGRPHLYLSTRYPRYFSMMLDNYVSFRSQVIPYLSPGGLCHNLPPVVYHSSIHHTLRPLTPGGCLS